MSVGMLLAPAPGEQTRRSVARKARDLVEMPQRKIEEGIEQAAEATKEKAADLGGKIGREAAETAVETVREGVLGKNRPA